MAIDYATSTLSLCALSQLTLSYFSDFIYPIVSENIDNYYSPLVKASPFPIASMHKG